MNQMGHKTGPLVMRGETISGPASQGRDHRVGFDGSGGQLMHKYEIIIYWSNDDEAFLAEVPELPGCMAHLDFIPEPGVFRFPGYPDLTFRKVLAGHNTGLRESALSCR